MRPSRVLGYAEGPDYAGTHDATLEREFARRHIGTVHTMQGRAADVIVFVLGTDTSPAKKARDWPARPAGLLNVAVSRARRRLFIIGDHAEWRDVPNFSEPARVLPRHTWWPPATAMPDTAR